MANDVSDSLLFLATMAQMTEMITGLEAQSQESRLRQLQIEETGEQREAELLETKRQFDENREHQIMTFNRTLYDKWDPNFIEDDPNKPGYKRVKGGATYENTLDFQKMGVDALIDSNSKQVALYPWLLKEGESMGDFTVTQRVADHTYFMLQGSQYSSSTGTILSDKYYTTSLNNKNLFTGIDESAGWLSESDIGQMMDFVEGNLDGTNNDMDDEIKGFLTERGILKSGETYDNLGTSGQQTRIVNKEMIMDRLNSFNIGLRTNKDTFFSSEIAYDNVQLEMLTKQAELAGVMVDMPDIKIALNQFKQRSEDLETLIPQVSPDGEAVFLFGGKEYDMLDDGDIKSLKRKDGGVEYYNFVKSISNGSLATIESYAADKKALAKLKKVLDANGQTTVYNNLVMAINEYNKIHQSASGASSFIRGVNFNAEQTMNHRQSMVNLTKQEFVVAGVKMTLGEAYLQGDASAKQAFFEQIKALNLDPTVVGDFLDIYGASASLSYFQ